MGFAATRNGTTEQPSIEYDLIKELRSTQTDALARVVTVQILKGNPFYTRPRAIKDTKPL